MNPIPLNHSSSQSTKSSNSAFAQWIGKQWARWNYARHIEPVWLEENELTISIRQLPAHLDGMLIAHLTDFHDGPQLPNEYFREVIERTNQRKPDLIALTGDYVHRGYGSVRSAAEQLSHLKAPQGIYAVLGNHDFSVRNALGIRRFRGLHQSITDALTNRGIKVLRNEGLLIADQLAIAGIDDLWSRECDPKKALGHFAPEIPRIVLAHNPLTVDLLADHRCDLLLSGHTHGGQVNWPGLGHVFVGRKSKEMASGLHYPNDIPMYVNKGVGFGWRFRFNVRPEIAFIRLVRAEES